MTKTMQETRLFWKIFCFHIRISLLVTLFVIFWHLAALRRHFPNTGWLLLDFLIEKISFQAKFGLKLE